MGLRSKFKLLKRWFDRQEGAGEGAQDTRERERDLRELLERACSKRVGRREVNVHRLGLAVVVDRLGGQLATDARLAVAAERHLQEEEAEGQRRRRRR